jgi:hypothetical protein
MRPMRWGLSGAVLLVLGCMPGTGSRLLGIGGSGGGGGAGSVALAFAVQPAGATEDEIITPAIQIVARDSLGHTDVTFTFTLTATAAGATTAKSGAFAIVAAP